MTIMVTYFISKISNTPVYTNDEFKQYLNQFRKDSVKFKTTPNFYKMVTVFKNQLPTGMLGYCIPSVNLVVVSRQVWNVMDEQERKILLYHEWGHCALQRAHVEILEAKTFCPDSLMYPYFNQLAKCYAQLEESYLEELFVNPHNYDKIEELDE